MIDAIRIADRIEGRHQAGVLCSLIEDSLSELRDAGREAAAEAITEFVAKWLPAAPQPAPLTPMTDVEARAFEAEKMPFGKYQGLAIEALSLDYLCHLTDPSDFIRKVKRYLKNETVKREMEDEG
jgi:hypothetical protein